MAWKLSRNRGADFKNTGLAKSTPSGTVCLGGGPCGLSPTGVVWAGPNNKTGSADLPCYGQSLATSFECTEISINFS